MHGGVDIEAASLSYLTKIISAWRSSSMFNSRVVPGAISVARTEHDRWRSFSQTLRAWIPFAGHSELSEVLDMPMCTSC